MLTACSHRQPDQVPKGEFGIEPGLRQRLLGLLRKEQRIISHPDKNVPAPAGSWQNQGSDQANKLLTKSESSESEEIELPKSSFIHAESPKDQTDREMAELISVLAGLDMDLTAANPYFAPRQDLGPDPRGRQRWLDFWGNEVIEVGASTGVVRPACSGIKELLNYAFPQLETVDLAMIKRWSQETPFFIFSQVPGPFSLLAGLTSFLDFLRFTETNQLELKQLAAAAGQWLGDLLQACITAGAQGIVITEDLAYNRGPWIRIKVLRQVFWPALAEMVQLAKKAGVPVLLHCDGDVRSLLPEVADLGFNGIHSLQPSAGVNLEVVKAEYGSRLCLMGNLDCDYLLPQGTVAEVEAATRETLRVGSPGGGFILSSCAGILSADWPAENVLAMYRTAASGKFF